MMVKMESTVSMVQPRYAQTEPEKLSPSGCPFDAEVRDEPFQEKPVESDLNNGHQIVEHINAGEADDDHEHDRAEKPGNERHRPAGEARFGRPGTCTHGNDPSRYQTSDPRRRDDQQTSR